MDLERDLAVSRAGEAALAEVLAVMSRTPPDLQAVLDTVVQRAGELCDARRNGSLFLIDCDTFHLVAGSPEPNEKVREWQERIRQPVPIERSYIVKHAFESKAVFHVRDATVEADSDYFRQDAVEFGYHTALGVPLLRGDAVSGVLSLIRAEVRPFTEREIPLVRAFADQAAIAIDNTRLSTETRDALERQIAVSQVLEAMSQSTADVSIVFRTIVRSAVNLCLADNASIFRADGEVYRHVASATASGRFADEAAFERIATEATRQGRLVKERATVVGKVLLERATVQIPDVRADPDYDNTRSLDFIAALSGTPARTILGVPIVKGAALVGIVIARRTEVSPFSPRESDVLETFARQAAVAVENVRLFNETKEALERQTATADILRAIAGSPTDLAPVLDAIATSVVRFCGATDAQVWIKRGDDLYPEAHYGDLPRSNRPVAASADTVSGAAMLERRTIHIPDVESEAANAFPVTRERFAALGQRAVLVAPLLREGSPIGTIALRKREPIPFTPNQIRLVEAFADQAVIAIENVRLFNETKNALEQQTATADVLKAISRSAFDLTSVFDVVVENANRLCHGDWAYIFRREGDAFQLVATSGGVPELVEYEFAHPTSIGPRTLVGRVAMNRRPVHIPDLFRDADYDWPPNREHGVHTVLGVPILREGDVIGVIGAARMEVSPFSDDEIRLIETFADQAAIAIENVRLFNETKEALGQQTATAEVLKTISRSVFDLNRVLATVAQTVASLCDADVAWMGRGDGSRLYAGARYGRTPELQSLIETVAPGPVGTELPGRNRSVMSLSFGRAEVINLPDFAATPYVDVSPMAKAIGARSLLAVPMLRDGAPIGVLIVARLVVRPFSDREIALVRTFADQAVIAIENVRLFNETKEALERETATAEVLRVTAQSTFEIQPVLDAVIRNATRIAGAENGFVYEADGDILRMTAAVGEKAETMREWQRTNPIRSSDIGTSTGRAFATGTTVHIPDVHADPTYTYWDAQKLGGFRTLLSLPLRRSGTPMGVIAMWRTEPRAFSDREIKLVETFADQAAIAMENVRLASETKVALEQQTAVAEVLKVISRSAFDLKPVLE